MLQNNERCWPSLSWKRAMSLRTEDKKRTFRFGDFIPGAYRAWGRHRAKGFVWLASNAGLIVLRGPQRFEFS